MNTKPLLASSVLLNAVCLGALGYLSFKAPERATGLPPEGGSTNLKARFLAGARAGQLPGSMSGTNAAVKSFDWRTVESTDYPEYINNLRAIGCPEETIRDIITADVNKLFDARRREARSASTNRFQFWKTGGNPLGDLLNEKRMAQQQEINKEKRDLLKALLGDNYTEKPGTQTAQNIYEELFDFLPAGKQSEIVELEEKFAGRLLSTLKDAQKGDLKAMREVQREKDAELAKIMSPQEKEEYDLRISQTATLMRMTMGDFQPTEAEFRNLFKLQKQFDDEFGIQGMQNNKDPEEVKRREAAKKTLDAEARTTLGEERYLEYKYSGSLAGSSLNKIVEEYQVPRNSALQVMDIQQVAEEQARQVRADRTLTPEQRQNALNALRAETEKEVTKLIGNAAATTYVEKGSWIKGLNRPPRSNPSN